MRNRFRIPPPLHFSDFLRVVFALAFIGLNLTHPIARERVQRRFDSTNGLQNSTIYSLLQDRDGFIWIGTGGGVVRYDGNQMRRWGPEMINRDVLTLAASPTGEIVAAENDGSLYRIVSDGVVPVIGADGRPITHVLSAEFDDNGNLWTVTDNSFQFRDAAGNWTRIDTAKNFLGQRVRRVRRASQGQIFVLTTVAIWRVRAGEEPRRVVDILRPVSVVEHPSGSLFVLAWPYPGSVTEITPDGRQISRATVNGRPIDIRVRRNVVWASFDRYLIALRPDEPPEEIGPHDGLPGGGPLLVDREQNLWLGTFSGLIQYPEPETTIWTQKDGLPSAHLRAIAQTHEAIWVFTWQGVGRVQREHDVWRAFDEKTLGSRPCFDNRDLLVFDKYPPDLVERRNEHFLDLPNLPAGVSMFGCARAHDGSLLFATTDGLLRSKKEAAPPEKLSSPLHGTSRAGVFNIFEDSQYKIWVSTQDGRICNASGREAVEGQEVSWSCQEIDQSPDMFDFEQMPSSTIWASTSRAGMWRYRENQWERIPGSKKLPSQLLYSLTAARNGGVWLVGQGITMRAVERLDQADGWEIVEVISAWEGLPGSETSQLIEEVDGDIWLSTPSGLVRVPAEARQTEALPPMVRTIEVVINGQSVDTSQHSLSLSHNSNVELHFSALSYRDRSRLRYQYRLRTNEPWIDSRDNAPVLRFVGLRPGNYQIEVRASLDGTNWTTTPAQLRFEVLNPWYLRPITLTLFAILLFAVLYLIYRARIGMLTRLEKQRARIAMDLHDQMGSGLGSIGILSGLAAQDSLSGVSRKDLAEKIAATAGELGNSLSEIVWALKPEAATLEALAYYLAERGGRLFPADVPAFITEFPEQWPKVELSLAVRRNLLLIASEALHNAARHSEARVVKFGICPDRGKRWRLWVADDGRGFSNGTSPSPGTGIGLNSMRTRADEITANISWTTNNGQGTIITVIFDPRAEDKRSE